MSDEEFFSRLHLPPDLCGLACALRGVLSLMGRMPRAEIVPELSMRTLAKRTSTVLLPGFDVIDMKFRLEKECGAVFDIRTADFSWGLDLTLGQWFVQAIPLLASRMESRKGDGALGGL